MSLVKGFFKKKEEEEESGPGPARWHEGRASHIGE